MLTDIIHSNLVWIIIWVIVFIITLLIELSTAQLVSIWFSASSIIVIILAICNVYWWIQLISFVVLSAVLLIVSKFLFKKNNDNIVRTNADSLVGQDILVTKEVTKEVPGEGKFNDIDWTIIVQEDIKLSIGEYATIKSIKGNKLVVTRKEK